MFGLGRHHLPDQAQELALWFQFDSSDTEYDLITPGPAWPTVLLLKMMRPLCDPNLRWTLNGLRSVAVVGDSRHQRCSIRLKLRLPLQSVFLLH
jgi:hypothetical protein